eukprot:CAMPEP_0197029140 /NCGR_PEP_ID=MMETSP1384-20130603/8649_1 /TAXON_ID=29189 /ORGANISM="Ammonia sp." /LENGTH=797 /DNA_ID=CAMNT_0042458245 /DNA_START=28 /DNA_END=2421 /DNA_ORIENTATION=-
MSSDKPNEKKWSLDEKGQAFLVGCITSAFVIAGFCTIRKFISTDKADQALPAPSKSSKIAHVQQAQNDDKTETENDSTERHTFKSKLGSKPPSQSPSQLVTDQLLTPHDAVYKRLYSQTNVNKTYYYQYVQDTYSPFVTAINLLVEYLPNSVLRILFSYLPPPHVSHPFGRASKAQQWNIDEYLHNGWEEKHDTLHDSPDIYVENVLPIQNQPTLIITIGLPGSGKTTWAKIRLSNGFQSQQEYVIAADDYFDKFLRGEFNPAHLGKAHNWAQKTVDAALRAGFNVVANNTHTTLPEMNWYVSRAVFGGLPHKIVFAVMPEMNTATLVRRGLHGVPPKKLKEMNFRLRKWLDRHPPSISAVLRAGAMRPWGRGGQLAKDVIYTGVFVDGATKRRLCEYFIGLTGQPLLCHVTATHLTLKYQPMKSDIDALPFGKKVKLKIVGYSVHDWIQTFVVDIMDGRVKRLCTNRYPHISVACNRSRCGPQYSNELLANGQVVPIISNFDPEMISTVEYDQSYRCNEDKGGLIVEGTVGIFTTAGRICYERPKAAPMPQRAGAHKADEEKWQSAKKKKKRPRKNNREKRGKKEEAIAVPAKEEAVDEQKEKVSNADVAAPEIPKPQPAMMSHEELEAKLKAGNVAPAKPVKAQSYSNVAKINNNSSNSKNDNNSRWGSKQQWGLSANRNANRSKSARWGLTEAPKPANRNNPQTANAQNVVTVDEATNADGAGNSNNSRRNSKPRWGLAEVTKGDGKKSGAGNKKQWAMKEKEKEKGVKEESILNILTPPDDNPALSDSNLENL